MQMFFNEHKKSASLAYPLILLLLGLLLLVIPYETLISMIFTFLGLFIIVISLIPCFLSFLQARDNKKYLVPALINAASIVFGLCIIFYHEIVISIIFAIWLIIFPLFRIIMDNNKKERIKKELPIIFIGFVLLFLPTGSFFEILLKICGGLLMALGLIYLVFGYIKNKKPHKNEPEGEQNRIIIDANCSEVDEKK